MSIAARWHLNYPQSDMIRDINKSTDGFNQVPSYSAILLLIISNYGVISKTEKVSMHQLARKG